MNMSATPIVVILGRSVATTREPSRVLVAASWVLGSRFALPRMTRLGDRGRPS